MILFIEIIYELICGLLLVYLLFTGQITFEQLLAFVILGIVIGGIWMQVDEWRKNRNKENDQVDPVDR